MHAAAPLRRVAFAAGLVFGGIVEADVLIEENVRIEGAVSMMNMSIHTTSAISGRRGRSDSQLKMDSGVANMFAGGATAEIVLLDQDTIYELDLKKKAYVEISLAAKREALQETMAKAEEALQSQQQSTSGVDESQCQWSEPTVKVERSGETADIAGFEAERTTVTGTQACTDRETGQVCEYGLVVDQWLTPQMSSSDEALAYHRAYAEQLGFDTSGSRELSQRAESMFAQYPGLWQDVVEKLKDVRGYAVKTRFALGVGGRRCQSSQQSTTTTAAAPSPTENAGRAVGGAIGGAIGGLFGRKKPAEPAAQAAQPAAPTTIADGLVPLMSISAELVSVSNAPLPADHFQVPANFRKKQPK